MPLRPFALVPSSAAWARFCHIGQAAPLQTARLFSLLLTDTFRLDLSSAKRVVSARQSNHSFSKACCAPFNNSSESHSILRTPKSDDMSLPEREESVLTQSIAEPESFVNALFPLKTIFQDPNYSIQSFLCYLETRKHHLFSSDAEHGLERWDIFQKLTVPNQEDAVEKFFRQIVQQADGCRPAGSNLIPRIWTSANKDQPARGGGVRCKPDLVCVDPAVNVSNDWGHFLALGEIKSGECTERQVYSLLHERAAMIFRHQDSRRFVLTFVLAEHHMTIALFDRGGSVVSKPFNVLDSPHVFLTAILGLSFASEDLLGRDPTVYTRPTIRGISSRHLPNVIIHCTLFIANRSDGRGTVVWLGELEGELSLGLPLLVQSYLGRRVPLPGIVTIPLVIKDTWVDEGDFITEGMILALLNHKGVKGVPRIVAEETVSAPLPAGWGENVPYPPDSTTLIRSRLRLSLGELRAYQGTTNAPRGYEPRVHVRLYSTPYAMPIFEFRSGLELLGIIADALTSHKQATLDYQIDAITPTLFPYRILHRDPSSRNIGMIPREDSDHDPCPFRTRGEHRGLLFDWGFSAIEEVGPDSHKLAAVDETDVDIDIVSLEGYILLPEEKDADCGLLTATPELIDDLDELVEVVRHCMHESSELDITGTVPYMSIELLVALLGSNGQNDDEPAAPMHQVRHDLEAFYMILVSLCLLFERPHQPKDFQTSYRSLDGVLPEQIAAYLTGQGSYSEFALRDRFVTFGTHPGFSTKVLPYFSPYFRPVVPYLQRIRQLIYGDHEWAPGPYVRPSTSPSHDDFLAILHNAMEEIPRENVAFTEINPPPVGFYAPISASGVWEGGPFDWRNPIMHSNNTFGYYRCSSEAPLQSAESPSMLTVAGNTFVDSGPETNSFVCKEPSLRKSQPSELYPLVPSIYRSSLSDQPEKKKRKTRKYISANSGVPPLQVRLRKRRETYGRP